MSKTLEERVQQLERTVSQLVKLLNMRTGPADSILFPEEDPKPKPEKAVRRATPTQEYKNGLYTKCVDIWFRSYESRTGVKPIFTGKEGRALKGILEQLWTVTVEKEQITVVLETIVSRWGELPKWYASNFTLAIINGKLNEIINCLKNGKEHSENGNSSSSLHDAFNSFYNRGQDN